MAATTLSAMGTVWRPGALVRVTLPSSTSGVMLSLNPVLQSWTHLRLGVKNLW